MAQAEQVFMIQSSQCGFWSQGLRGYDACPIPGNPQSQSAQGLAIVTNNTRAICAPGIAEPRDEGSREPELLIALAEDKEAGTGSDAEIS